ncbi:MAG TPA: VOC family protein [Chloroflexota bacterium]|nr:VOC family protein [Chloroflexota bacterium]
MPEYSPGTPMWIDLGTSDVEASKRFYGGLFGWQTQDLGPEAGGYGFFTLNGKMVGGVGPLMNPQQPPAWSTYISTSDAEATARSAQEAGGTVVVQPMDVMGQGKMSAFTDPSGAYIAAWQPIQHSGAEVINEPNSYCWTELATRDIETAKRFYPRVFGWGAETNQNYTEWKVGGRSVAGAMPMSDQMPANVPPHWLVYFAVADCDASANRAQELGANVMVPPMDVPVGRFAVLGDPQGARFGIIKLSGQM